MAGEEKSPPAIGLEIREAHFPGRAPIDSYGNGGFRFADMSHKGSLMFLPSGIYAWNAVDPSDITLKALEKVLEEAADIELLVLGTGNDLLPVSADIREALRAKGMAVEPMGTGAAVRTLNILLAEERAVAAALLAVHL